MKKILTQLGYNFFAASVMRLAYVLPLACVTADYFFDTGPLVCRVDPNCRKLTPDEISLVKPIFQHAVRYHEVLVFKRKPILTYLFDLPLPKTYHAKAVASDNNMYFPDLSGSGDHRKLVHEFTHIAQYQLGIKYAPLNLSNRWQYEYELKKGMSFSEYGREQQAEIVADYYEILNRAQDTRDRKSRAAHCKNIRAYANVIGESLPVQVPTICSSK